MEWNGMKDIMKLTNELNRLLPIFCLVWLTYENDINYYLIMFGSKEKKRMNKIEMIKVLSYQNK